MGYLLRRHLAPFGIAFAVLTSWMLILQIVKQVPGLLRSGAPSGVIAEALMLSMPFIVAMTLPMAVLIAVLRVFTRLEPEPDLTARIGKGVSPRRLVTPVLGAAACVAALAFVLNDQILPRSNHRLRQLLVEVRGETAGLRTESPDHKGDREMTISELRRTARAARQDANRAAVDGFPTVERAAGQRAATYDVEIQKKYAIAAACFVLALFAAPVGLLFRRGGMTVVIALAFGVFSVYYVCLIGGEELGDRQIVSPFFAMWIPNLIFGIVGALALWRIPVASQFVSSGRTPPASY